MSLDKKDYKPWGGRFSAPTDEFVMQFTASIGVDHRLYSADIQGSIAHAQMLALTQIISNSDAEKIAAGLESIKKEIEAGDFKWQVALEDVHMNIETRLIELIGDTGKKLHTGRSRNDQVATDIRLYLREEIKQCQAWLGGLSHALLDIADREADSIMPGFTHLQGAQPVTFGHHMMAWFEMLKRDRERLADCLKRVNQLPLGAAALAGTSFPIDREWVATTLGFEGVCLNSLDAVSDRDFIIEFHHCAALIMMHLSRFSEELIIWSSQQFDFIELSDAFCTGSSIMPQKKNPDVPEVVRGKTGRVYGHLMGLLTLMKGQPLAYNKDNQEDKEPLFDTVDTLKDSLRAFTDMLPAMDVKQNNLRKAAAQGFSTATDLADYLVRKKIPFRDAHEIVGNIVAHAIKADKMLHELSLEVMTSYCNEIGEDIYEVLTLEGSAQSRNHIGGTAPEQVRKAILIEKAKLAEFAEE